MHEPHIIEVDAPHNLKVFAALCMSSATLWQLCDIDHYDIRQCVDWLQHYAEKRGLVDEFGQDRIQQIMHFAFLEVRDDLVRGPNGEERYAP